MAKQYRIDENGNGIGIDDPNDIIPRSEINLDNFNLVAPNEEAYQEHKLQEEAGTPGQQILAHTEAALRGFTLGGSDIIENMLASDNPDLFSKLSKEARKKRIAANPSTQLSNMIGSGALLAVSGGFAAPIEGALGAAKGTAQIATWAADAALLETGNLISEAALGDPSLNGQKILASLGGAVVTGGVLGGLAKAFKARPAFLRRAKKVPKDTPIEEITANPEDRVYTFEKGKDYESVQEIGERIEEKAKVAPELLDLPEKAVMDKAIERMNPKMEFPIAGIEKDAYKSKPANDKFLYLLGTPGKTGETLQNLMNVQAKELTGRVETSIREIAPHHVPAATFEEAGGHAQRLLDQATNKIKKELIPKLEELRTIPGAKNNLYGVINFLTDKKFSQFANPALAQLFKFKKGAIEMVPYAQVEKISHRTYIDIERAIGLLKQKPTSIKSLFNIREGLSANIEKTASTQASQELTQAQAAFLDYIQKEITETIPDAQVRDLMRKYAINEQNIDMIQRTIGADIEKADWRRVSKDKPEEAILNKIFTNSATVKSIKAILSPEKFDEVLADYLSVLKNRFTTDGVLSSKNFRKFLKNNQASINNAFKESNTEAFKDIDAALTTMALFPQATPGNPSKSGTTLIRALKDQLFDPADWLTLGHLRKYGGQKWDEVVTDRLNAQELNQQLQKTTQEDKNLNIIKGISDKISMKIESEVKSIFRGAVIKAPLNYMSQPEYEKVEKQITEFTRNPASLMDKVVDDTSGLYEAAPQTTQAIQAQLFQQIAYLNSKLPQNPQSMYLTSEFKPSDDQRNRFNRHFQAVTDPLQTLEMIKSESLSNEAMESLNATCPQLLYEMRSKIFQDMTKEKAEKLTYGQRICLAKFLDHPLDENMTPLGIIGNQMALKAPSLSQQPPPPSKRLAKLTADKRKASKANQVEE